MRIVRFEVYVELIPNECEGSPEFDSATQCKMKYDPSPEGLGY